MSVPPGKGGKPYGKSPKFFVLKIYGLRQKSKILRFKNLRLNRTPYSHFKNLRINRTLYTKFFNLSHTVIIPANYADFAQFAHTVRELRETRTFLLTYSILCFRHLPRQRTLQNSSELRKFHAVRPHSPRITRNSHHLLTLYITFQMPNQWQGMP